MGIRGELFSTKVALQNRTYFFNVKENRMGDLYLNIVESKNKESGGFDRQSIILFSDDMREFLSGFDESMRVLEKAEREKRRSGIPGRDKPGNDKPEHDKPRKDGFRQDSRSQDSRPGRERPDFKPKAGFKRRENREGKESFGPDSRPPWREGFGSEVRHERAGGRERPFKQAAGKFSERPKKRVVRRKDKE